MPAAITQALPGPSTTQSNVTRTHGQVRWQAWLAYLLLAIAAGLGTWLAMRALRPPQLMVVLARTETVSRILAVTGRVEAQQTVRLSPRAEGRITEISRREGEQVKAGDVLARLEDVAARAGVTQQKAELSSQSSDLAQQLKDLRRSEALARSGVVSPSELEDARLRVTQGRQELIARSAELRERKTQLTLIAPFDGTIVRREAEVGQVVGPNTELFEIATVSHARIAAEVDERYIARLRRGMRAQVLPLGVAQAPSPAKVSYVAQAVDPQTGAATVRFAYDRQPDRVLVGASVDINVSVDTVPRAITIPREAVASADGRDFVLVVKKGRTERRPVQVDDWPAEWVIVTQGLRSGETVAVDPSAVSAGAQVRPEVQHAL